MDELEETVGETYKYFIVHLKNIKEVDKVVNGDALEIEHAREVFAKFDSDWQVLQENFDLSEPLKIHIIRHHILEYMKKTDTTLLKNHR